MEQHLRDQEQAKQQLQQLKHKDKSQQSEWNNNPSVPTAQRLTVYLISKLLYIKKCLHTETSHMLG